jgi:signal transduction histidine kinase
MAEIGRIISSTLNIEEVYERFAEEVRKIIPLDRIAINITNPDHSTATTAYTSGLEVMGRQRGDTIPLAGTATEDVMRKRSGVIIRRSDRNEMAPKFPALLATFAAGIQSIMVAPLISKDQAIGVLHIQSQKPNAYSEGNLRVAERVGTQIAGAIANAQLFTEHIRSEEEKTALQEQFRQSQKMEAVGRLAGGIAHDFNNLLTVIKGYSQLSLLDLKETDILWGNIQEIQKATQRAADLTRQLLAFSRRQILDLKVLDLNTLLKDLNKMLRRIIGEDIELVFLLTEDLGRVKIDPGQFEQMVLNLAVNARDAMPSGGKLTIETANAELDEEYARTHISVKSGPYVQLSISDTGVGMPQDIKEKVFDPFFTTKEKGKGTGLGLSTVYGIVKQSEGNIWVYSEPGHGTTFKIYLPRVEEELDSVIKQEETASLPKGTETVLLVEDDPLVRDLARRLLIQQGYTVLEASNGEEALRVAQEHDGEKIHLLLTDVVMPQMGGKELSEKLKPLRPDIGILYTSGYTDNAIVHHGTLEPGTYFLQKPFSPKTLSHKVREVLDR